MTIDYGQIMHTTSNETTTTLWIVRHGQINLTPCYLNFYGQYCTLINLPTTLHYSKISSIREKYNHDLDMTSYLFGGTSGEMCFRYPTSTRCENTGQVGGPIYIKINFGPSSEIFYACLSFSPDHSYIYRYTVTEFSLNEEQIRENPTQQTVDLFMSTDVIHTFSYDIVSSPPFHLFALETFLDVGSNLMSTETPAQLDNSEVPQYINTNYIMKKFNQMAYVYSFAALIIFSFQNEFAPTIVDVQLLPFFIYDIEVITDTGIAYIVSNDGLLEYTISSKTSESIPLNTNIASKTIVKLLSGIDALMIIEKETNNIQFYQYQNFENDLKELIIEVIPEEESEYVTESISKSSFQNVCLLSEFSGCKLFCENSCLECNSTPNNCSICKPFYTLNNEMNCVLSPISSFLKFFISIISLYRPQRVQQLFFFIANLNNYNYHKTEYSGFFKEVLMYVDSIQDEIWSLLPFDNIKNWIRTPIPISSYTPYTSIKYQEMQRGDSMFFQNTKEFFVVYFLVTIVLFILFNKLFYIISHLKISKYIRNFSFWLYALFLVIFQNWQQLLIISLSHLFNIFCFDFQTKMTQIASIFIISMIVIPCIVIFPMFYYLYNKKSTYFLSNIKFTSHSWIIMGLQFVLVSGIETAIHICLTEHPGLQKILLSTNGIFFAITFFFLYMKYNIFISQGTFWIELILRSLLSLLNIILYFRYDKIEFTEITYAFDILINTVLYCFMIFLCIEGIYPILDFLITKIIFKIKEENISNLVQTNNEIEININIEK